SFAYYGGGSFGGNCEIPYGMLLNRLLGVGYYYSPAGQEFLDLYWVENKIFGRHMSTFSDITEAETLIVWGWNGMVSHQMPRAPLVLKEIAKSPGRKLIVIDPRRSETAEIADIHLSVRPGADSLLIKAMISILIDNNWENKAFIAEHLTGWDQVRPWFENFDARAAIAECGLDYETVREVTRLVAVTKSCLRHDLGIFMNRNGRINIYMQYLLLMLCGRFFTPGGQNVSASMNLSAPRRTGKPGRPPLRTVVNNMFAIQSIFSPAFFPEEVLNDHPERLRAVFVSGCNPARSYPDALAQERALREMELSVSVNIFYDETARCCKYVLPVKAYLESWDATFFSFDYPNFYFQLRGPVLEPAAPDLPETSEIYFRLAEVMGFVPEYPAWLHEAAATGNFDVFNAALKKYVAENPEQALKTPFAILGTLGKAIGFNKSTFFLNLSKASPEFYAGCREMGLKFDENNKLDVLFRFILANESGAWLSKLPEDQFRYLAAEDKKLAVHVEELEEAIRNITPERERRELLPPEGYPFILCSGYHNETVANTLQRNPAWNEGRKCGNLYISAEDAAQLGVSDGETLLLTTEATARRVPVEITPRARPGTVYLQHGFGLIYDGVAYGVSANEFTKTTRRNDFGTPLHKRVPCRLAKI
ncbi:MAG: molybdopterin-dependent oxidoreductase, partial [Oscillospiraceae bacterium]|nr:molybdopterin-dependent oxidoreductase [Oscillospiraceae bacterium]